MGKNFWAEVNAETIKNYMLAIGKTPEDAEKIARMNKMATKS